MHAAEAIAPAPLLPPLTAEDAARSRDRSRVHEARRQHRRWRLLWLLVGPGILAMLGENDGPSMIAYASDGAQYGLGFFVPFIPVLFAMAFVCQEMCMRVGAVTHRGYGELVLQRYGRAWGWFGAGDLTLTNLVTLVAEFVSIRVGLAYFHLSSGVAVVLGLALVVFTLSGGRYWRWERIVLGMALFNGLFLLAAILVKPNLGAVAGALDFTPFPGGSFNTLLLLLASTIGATVTPWMIFFQQSASADKGMTPTDVRHGRYDTAVGGVLAAVFGIGALIAGAALLTHGGSGIQGFAGAGFPEALKHAAGGAAGAVFAAVVILIPGAPLLSIALNANVLATVLLPVSLVLMVMLANDKGLMGPWANKRSTNVVGIAVIAFVGLCGAAYGIDSFLLRTHLIG
jgi:Mn2+/Fe2+ NRAMP family transporter